MTREEAIEWLKAEKNARMCFSNLHLCESIDMAISALSNQQKWIDEELQKYLIENADLVTCKDCRHKVLTADGEYNPEDIVCDYWMSDGLDSNDFCSYGVRAERREP